MRPSTLQKIFVDGPAGRLETDINDPGEPRRGVALIAHPHPQHGGSKDNKVVTTLARALFGLGYVVLRPNYRGVGESAGSYDEGIGETEDMLAVAAHARNAYGDAPPLLAGFSFGCFVQTRVARRITAERLILVAPAVTRFEAGTVPDDTLVIHGERDDVVALGAVLDWARPQSLPVVVVPGGEHFFHGRLNVLHRIVTHFYGAPKAE
ncbi:MAG TPA: alpha/beta hydrolase [Burkholderiales bacterium]|nr:alpha/beta hydrolase [Burkholderiales bacterium]